MNTVKLTDGELDLICQSVHREVEFWADQLKAATESPDRPSSPALARLAEEQIAAWSSLLAKLELAGESTHG